MTILLVDDEVDTRTVARLSLKQLGGFSVIEAANGADALAIASRHPVDAIVLDVMMPGLDGPAVLEALRANPATARVPVVFLTAKAMPQELERLKALDIAAIHTKPFDPATFAANMRRLLTADEPAAQLPAPEASTGSTMPRVDAGALRQLQGLTTETGADLMGALIDLFETTTPATLEALAAPNRGGAGAAAIERAAHSLKGAAATLGAADMAEIARTIEQAARDGTPLDLAPLLTRLEVLLHPTVAMLRAERQRILDSTGSH